MTSAIIGSFIDTLNDKASKSDGIAALMKVTPVAVSNLNLGVDGKLGQLSVIKNKLNRPELNINVGNISTSTLPASYTNAINITESLISFNLPLMASQLTIGNIVENTDISVRGIAGINNLYVSSQSIFNKSVTLLSTLNIAGESIFNNIKLKDISSINNDSTILEEKTININAKYINIGNGDSIVKIKGPTTYVETTELYIKDKILSLNLSETNTQGFDIGGDSGITIVGTSINGDGYIKTNNLATRFLIKSPLDRFSSYINTVDLNNNLTISGTTDLLNTVHMYSNVYITGNSNFNNVNIHSDLSVLSNTKFFGETILINNAYML